VVVLDPGHGGLDSGTKNGTITEKDLTLAIARRLRTALQTRLGVTALLTRDADVEMANEARTAVANNNQANLFISLHIGESPNPMDSSSSIFVMKDDFSAATGAPGRDRIFLPWYEGFRKSQPASRQIGKLVQEELTKAIPGWQFVLRSAPLGVLSSTTMPCIALEIGNLNNSVNSQSLNDAGFQTRLVNSIVNAIQRYADGQTAATPSP
jgi:N-acetylmuramoyl-L-alanine amidase